MGGEGAILMTPCFMRHGHSSPNRLYNVRPYTAKKRRNSYFDFTSDLFFHICTKMITVLVQIWKKKKNRSLVESKYDLHFFFFLLCISRVPRLNYSVFIAPLLFYLLVSGVFVHELGCCRPVRIGFVCNPTQSCQF